jgi:hypothetical protein
MQNLLGNEDALTIDMWLSRTFGRLTGTNMSETVPSATMARATAAFAQALQDGDPVIGKILKDVVVGDLPGMSIDELAVISRKLVRAWDQHRRGLVAEGGAQVAQSEKRRMKWPYVAQALSKHAAFPVDAPETARKRAWMQVVMRRAVAILGAHGHDLSVSGLQAVLWYPEKQLVSVLTGRRDTTLNISFSEAFEMVAAKEGIDHDRIRQARDAAPARGGGGHGPSGGVEPGPEPDVAVPLQPAGGFQASAFR